MRASVTREARLSAIGRAIAAGARHPDMPGCFPPDFSDEERRRAVMFACYQLRYGARRGRRPAGTSLRDPALVAAHAAGSAERHARRLLRSWLPPAAQRHLSTHGYVPVRGSEGGVYRLWPSTGLVEACALRGQRWRAIAAFCYHDVHGTLPVSDVTLAQYLVLRTDEGQFLATANLALRDLARRHPEVLTPALLACQAATLARRATEQAAAARAVEAALLRISRPQIRVPA